MKPLHLFLSGAFLLLGLSAAAQAPVYLFDEFTEGTVLLKNRSVVKTKFNLDLFHDKFLYMDGEEIMEMTDFSNVSVVTIGGRTFVPQGKSLYELIELDGENSLLVKRHRKKNPMGKKGAYDQILHGSSAQSIDPEYYSPSLTKRGGEEVMNILSDNKYGLLSGGKFRAFSDKRSFLKLFPARKQSLESYINNENILFSEVEDVIQLVKFALTTEEGN